MDVTDDDREPDFITQAELARRAQVSVRTIQRLKKSGVLPANLFLRFGSRQLVRVDWAKFQDWLENYNVDLRAQERGVREVREVKPDDPRLQEGDGGPGMRLLS